MRRHDMPCTLHVPTWKYWVFNTKSFEHYKYRGRGAYSRWFGPQWEFLGCYDVDRAEISSVMTHVLGLSAKVRNERSKCAVMADSRHRQYVWADFRLQLFMMILIREINLPNFLFFFFWNPPYSYLLTHAKIALPCTFPHLAQNL